MSGSEVVSVRGFCPMGCGETLAVVTGILTCRSPGCLEPRAATIVLSDNERQHIVEFADGSFLSRHPLWERIYTQLSDCTFQEELANDLVGPPVPPGVYRVSRRPGGEWEYEPVPKEFIHG